MSLASKALARTISLFLAVALLFSSPVLANPWNEVGDAGELPGSAQITFGNGPMTSINGRLFTDADVDMYCVAITDEANFSASYTFCTSHAEPDLWLFAANGIGVTHADFCQASLVRLTTQFVTSPGFYYLAISGTNGDAMKSGVTIWQSTNVNFTERSPDGPGAPGPITSWSGARVVSTPNYTIQLTGAEFCDFPVPATPSTWGNVKSRYAE